MNDLHGLLLPTVKDGLVADAVILPSPCSFHTMLELCSVMNRDNKSAR